MTNKFLGISLLAAVLTISMTVPAQAQLFKKKTEEKKTEEKKTTTTSSAEKKDSPWSVFKKKEDSASASAAKQKEEDEHSDKDFKTLKNDHKGAVLRNKRNDVFFSKKRGIARFKKITGRKTGAPKAN